jgi:hypothetical protein
MDLYRDGAFVSQATKDQCVAAAAQIMLNIVGPGFDGTAAMQAKLALIARGLSGHPDDGTEPQGWARALEELGASAYDVVVEPSRSAAIRRGIVAMRETGRPVGLLVWRGAHSWVMHGFETDVDPAVEADFKVRSVRVSDPWYPRISSIWGESRAPDQAVTVAELGDDYLPWRRPTGRYPGQDGGYVLVIPVTDREQSPA